MSLPAMRLTLSAGVEGRIETAGFSYVVVLHGSCPSKDSAVRPPVYLGQAEHRYRTPAQNNAVAAADEEHRTAHLDSSPTRRSGMVVNGIYDARYGSPYRPRTCRYVRLFALRL